jgi:adenylate cyclase class 2
MAVFEVEAKVQVRDFVALRAALAQLGAQHLGAAIESDVFFAHPQRDFRETDEALRLREVDGVLELTYKGPNRSATLKSRLEHNMPVGEDPTPLLAALGFVRAAELSKQRESWKLGQLTVTLDELEFGKFVEVEALGEDEVKAAELVEAGLVKLGIQGPKITESYLNLLERHRAR